MTTAPTDRPGPAALAWHGARRVHHRGRRQPRVVALEALDLEVVAGELLVLLGPSGSGKSTALRLLAGVEPLDAGRVEIDGRDVTDVPPERRDVAMVFQDLALFGHLDVAANITFGRLTRELPVDERRRRLAEVVDVLDLGGLLDRRPDELSGGQRQRVALARAMIRTPRAFLLDEPMSDLDARLREEARAQIVALQRRLGTTMVHVTHDQDEAMAMADRIAVLHDGALTQVGTVRELYDRPADRRVAGFLGTPRMAFLEASSPLVELTGEVVAVGVRAEDLRVADDGERAAIEGRVVAVEDRGRDVLLRVSTAAGDVAVREEAADPDVRAGTRVRVALRPTARLHRFDAAGRRVETAGDR